MAIPLAGNPNDPASWSPARQRLVWGGAFVLVGALAWSLWLSAELSRLNAERLRETELTQSLELSYARVRTLPSLEATRAALTNQVEVLERELPSGAELESVMSAITAAGRTRGLQFELFRPAPPQLKAGHAELPVAIRVSGGYHDIGGFLGDLSQLPRLVTLHGLVLAPQAQRIGPERAAVATRVLVLEGTLRAYRALDESEVAQVRRRESKAQPVPTEAPAVRGGGTR